MNLAAHFPYSSKQHVFYVFNTYLLQDVKNSVRIVLIMKNYINKKRKLCAFSILQELRKIKIKIHYSTV